jgi:drug/metabolite transporter (DMT)-like permease
MPAPRGALDVSLLLWMTATAVILGLILWNYGVRRLGIVISAFYLNFVPVFAILIISLLGTPPSLMQLLGGLLVLIGVLQSQLRHISGRRRASATAED